MRLYVCGEKMKSDGLQAYTIGGTQAQMGSGVRKSNRVYVYG